jgi:hypothetical protein
MARTSTDFLTNEDSEYPAERACRFGAGHRFLLFRIMTANNVNMTKCRRLAVMKGP